MDLHFEKENQVGSFAGSRLLASRSAWMFAQAFDQVVATYARTKHKSAPRSSLIGGCRLRCCDVMNFANLNSV